jgi:hypothetical protein
LSQLLQQDLLRQLLLGSSRRPALPVDLLLELVPLQVVPLELVPPLPVVPEGALVGPAADLWKAAAVPRLPDCPAPEQPDSYHRLPAALVPKAELARAKPTQTRL